MVVHGNVTVIAEVIQFSSSTLLVKEVDAITTLMKGESLLFEKHQYFVVNVDVCFLGFI